MNLKIAHISRTKVNRRLVFVFFLRAVSRDIITIYAKLDDEVKIMDRIYEFSTSCCAFSLVYLENTLTRVNKIYIKLDD